MNILITGSRAPVALEFSRRLNHAGHKVFLADSIRSSMASHSNSAHQFFLLPRPAQSPREFAASLAKVISQNKIELVIPTCEEVFFISHFRDQFDCDLLNDDFAKLKWIHNKWTFSQACQNLIASAPETVLLPARRADNAASSPGCFRFGPGCVELGEDRKREDTREWVFKPVYSRFASRTLIGPSPEQLLAEQKTWREDWIAQRRIRGVEYSTYSIARRGQLLAHVTYHSLYRAGLGSGICFQPVQIAEIEGFVQKFVAKFEYHGQIGFDFMIDTEQKLWVLEANPRATSGAQLFAKCDPLEHALLLQSDSLLRPSTSRPAMLEFAMPLWGLKDAVRSGKWLRYPWDLCRSRWLCTDWRDLKPTLALTKSLLELRRISKIEKCSLQQASTFDIEWNGEPL